MRPFFLHSPDRLGDSSFLRPTTIGPIPNIGKGSEVSNFFPLEEGSPSLWSSAATSCAAGPQASGGSLTFFAVCLGSQNDPFLSVGACCRQEVTQTVPRLIL